MGLISHYATDVVYHPPIFFFTGDYYAIDSKERSEARARHRLFEVYLDEDRSTRLEKLPWSTSLQKLIHSVPPKVVEAIYTTLAEAVTPAILTHEATLVPTLANEWRSSLAEMARFQFLFLSQFWGSIAQALSRLSFGHLDQFEVLFARGRTGEHPSLHEPWSYRNPVSGDFLITSVKELDEQATQLTLDLFTVVQDALNNGGVTPSTLAGGVSLNYGLKSAAPEDATFFSPGGFPLSGLSVPT